MLNINLTGGGHHMFRKVIMALICCATLLELTIPASATESTEIKYQENNIIITMEIGQTKLKAGVTDSNGNTVYWPITTSPAYIPVYQNGEYTVTVFKNIQGTRYSQVMKKQITVSDLSVFVAWAPNVNPLTSKLFLEDEDVKAVISGKNPKAVFDFVRSHLTYDKDFDGQKGYVPNLDDVWTDKSGICYDYAAAVAIMLRTENIPCKIVVGYANGTYHAWNEVQINGEWIFLDSCWNEYETSKYTRIVTNEW